MSAREVILLGTSSQVPTRARGHNALFLRWDDLGILFDPGEGTQRQMLMAGIAATQITHIAITHFHGDHCLGLAAMLQRISLDRVPHPVYVLFPASGQVFFERLRYASVYREGANIVPCPLRYQDPPASLSHGLQEAWSRDDVQLFIAPLDHRIDCLGYRLQERDGRRMRPDLLREAGVAGPQVRELIDRGQIEVAGRTVRLDQVSEPRRGQVFSLVMDTRPCPGADDLAQGADLLVCESTFLSSEAQEAHDYQHMTAAQAATLAQKAGARTLLLTHFSQRYTSLEGFAAEAGAIFPGVVVGPDFTRVPVPPREEKSG
jgi:ribonuclease Z